MKNLAILGSWDPLWIEDHLKWFNLHGPHHDAWKNKINNQILNRIKNQLNENGHLNFYAYMPKGKKGNGLVQYRLILDDFRYLKTAQLFKHEYGHHHDNDEYAARFIFRIIDIQKLQNPLPLSHFIKQNGKRINHPVEVIQMPIIIEPEIIV